MGEEDFPIGHSQTDDCQLADDEDHEPHKGFFHKTRRNAAHAEHIDA